MAERAATRVVLLARTGEACDRLAAALAQAGAEVAMIADPLIADPASITAAQPQAVLVALEPAIEPALERLEDVFADPAIAVIFDEAELAARRDGWEAARWARHLVAKLHRHDDVLPPGADAEPDLRPAPGALPPQREDAGVDLAALAGEAEDLAAGVPRGEPLDPLADGAGADATPAFEPLSLVDADALFATLESGDVATAKAGDDAAVLPFDRDAAFDDAAPGGRLSLVEDATTSASPARSDVEASTLDPAAGDGLSLFDEEAASSASPARANVDEASSFDPAAGDGLSLIDEDAATTASSVKPDADETTTFDPAIGDGLSLADPDAPIEHARAPQAIRAPDLDALSGRVAQLSLAEADSYGHGAPRGAVLVEGGLGAPDAVRQLLAAVPEGFPRPILVRLHLDGGRYDRLVKQMARVARLPVALARADETAEPGHVYFLAPAQSLRRDGARLAFVDASAAHDLLSALPAADSVHLFLSGSDPALVDAALAHADGDATRLGAQSPEGCYDSTATSALIARGALAGTPAELAARLAQRWPS